MARCASASIMGHTGPEANARLQRSLTWSSPRTRHSALTTGRTPPVMVQASSPWAPLTGIALSWMRYTRTCFWLVQPLVSGPYVFNLVFLSQSHRKHFIARHSILPCVYAFKLLPTFWLCVFPISFGSCRRSWQMTFALTNDRQCHQQCCSKGPS